VTLPRTVTPLSWRNWDPHAWEQTWVYRKHFATPPAKANGIRVFLDVDAAITDSAELTGYLSDRDNVLAITLDSRFNLDVPPNRPAPSNPRSIDYWEPGGIYRDARLRFVPQVFICDVFAKPVNVLTAAQRAVQVQCTLDAAIVPHANLTVAVELLDGDQTVATTSVPVMISQTGQVTVTGTLSGLAAITLWDTGCGSGSERPASRRTGSSSTGTGSSCSACAAISSSRSPAARCRPGCSAGTPRSCGGS
jgi:beta-galactosidase